ncbi:DegV family protein [Lagierella sp.]|uniref:DegV family protein n=1 Tax=Lagierella sp. TaxID=2849657 RepID=UPI00262F914D|nr:DegV family protein [Lagierella sp.]
MKINIITDNSASLSMDFIEREKLIVLPLLCFFEDESYNIMELSYYDKFYEKLVNSTEFPKTSQPSLGEILTSFKEALKDDPDYVFVMTISKALSGFYKNSLLAKEMLNDERIIIVDTRTTTVNLKRMIEYLCELRKLNLSKDIILDRLYKMREGQEIYFIPENLEYLYRGGRLSKASAAIGDLLKICPIITLFEDGSLGLYKKIRGEKKALKALESYISEDIKYISVVYVLKKEKAIELRDRIQNKFPDIEVLFEEVSPNIGCHIGPGTVGILFGTYKNLEEDDETVN